MVMSCIHCYISGKVQGVWFRQSALQRAEMLGVVGWIRNLPDGRVECLACGEPAALVRFRDWLQEGPPAARVEAVDCVPATQPQPLPEQFEIRR